MDEKEWRRFEAVTLKESDDGCLLWTGTVTSNASGRYPTFCTGGRKLSARMLYFERTNGFRPPGVRSKCGNIMCFRHLVQTQPQEEQRRRRQQEAQRDRLLGRPHKVVSASASDHVDALMADGMSVCRIAEKAGVSPSAVSRLLRRESATAYAFIVEAVLGVKSDGGVVAGWGPKLTSVASSRMLMAMIADGFPQASFLAPRLGVSDDFVKRAIGRPGHRLFAKNIHAIRGLYAELEDVDPLSVGVTPFAKSRALAQARKGNYPPRHTWDPETIDDPDAFPEYTGRCGSTEGYSIHRREEIPPCRPCVEARNSARRNSDGPRESRSLQQRDRVIALHVDGFSHRAITAETEVPFSTVRYYIKQYKIRESNGEVL